MTQTLNVVVIGRVRDEFKLDDVDDLKKAIKTDGKFCDTVLDWHVKWLDDPHFAANDKPPKFDLCGNRISD